jgi:hypothetical protein
MDRLTKIERSVRLLFAAQIIVLLAGLAFTSEPASARPAALSEWQCSANLREHLSCDGFTLVQWRAHKAHLDAKRFSSRIKKHLVHRSATSKAQFRSHQAKLEHQRRVYQKNRAKLKAQQFAAARRHAAKHSSKHRLSRHNLAAPYKWSVDGSNTGRWQMLWHRVGHDDAQMTGRGHQSE